MEIIPLNKKVLLKPIKEKKEETKTSGGLFLAENNEFDVNRGEVIAFGEKVELKLKKGDNVIYEDIGADKVGDLILVEESKILALIK